MHKNKPDFWHDVNTIPTKTIERPEYAYVTDEFNFNVIYLFNEI